MTGWTNRSHRASSWRGSCSSRCSTPPTAGSVCARSWSTVPATPSSPVPRSDRPGHQPQLHWADEVRVTGDDAHADTVRAGLADPVGALEGAVACVLQRDGIGCVDERAGRVDGAVQCLHRDLTDVERADVGVSAHGSLVTLVRWCRVDIEVDDLDARLGLD